MILELSDIRIQPGTHDQFDAAIEGAIGLTIAKAVVYLGHHAHKDIESPEYYVLTVHWNTLKTTPPTSAVRPPLPNGAASYDPSSRRRRRSNIFHC